MQTGRAARGTIQLAVSQACLFISGYVITILLARGLGPEDYGIYGIILSILFWVEQTSRLGIPSATAKLIAEDRQGAPLLAQTVRLLGAGLFCVAFALLWATAPMLAGLFHLPDGASLLRLAAFDIPFYGMYFIYRGVSQGRREFATLSMASASYGLGKVVGILGMWALGLSIEGALMVNILGSCVALAVIASRTPVPLGLCDAATVRLVLRLGFPLAMWACIASLLYQLDLWSLKVLLPGDRPQAIGIYMAATQVGRIPQLGVQVVSIVLFASLARASSSHDIMLAQRYVQGAIRFLWVVLLPLSVLTAVEAEEIMTLLFSLRFAGGGAVLRVLIFGFSLFAFWDAFSTMLHAKGEMYISVAIGVALLVVQLALNLALIPVYGPLGAAWAMAATMGVGTLITGVLVYRRFGMLLPSATLVRGVAATVVMVSVGAQVAVPGLLLALQYLGLLGVYVLALAALGELRWEDLRPFALWKREATGPRS
jgi:stage V sporulation protein B